MSSKIIIAVSSCVLGKALGVVKTGVYSSTLNFVSSRRLLGKVDLILACKITDPVSSGAPRATM